MAQNEREPRTWLRNSRRGSHSLPFLPHLSLFPAAYLLSIFTRAAQMPSLITGLGTAGVFNVTHRPELMGRSGKATPSNLAWLYTADGTPYLYSVYPEVASISPATGSAAGGTRVTLRGRGFPDLRRQLQGGAGGSGGGGRRDRVSVWLGGAPCEVVDSTYSRWVKLRGFGGLGQGQVTCNQGIMVLTVSMTPDRVAADMHSHGPWLVHDGDDNANRPVLASVAPRSLTCVTAPQPAAPPLNASASPIAGLYPGMRGVEYEVREPLRILLVFLYGPGFAAHRNPPTASGKSCIPPT